MQPVDSTAVARIGYDADAAEVHVEFHSGRTYAYLRVGPATWRDFETSESKGGFVNRVLKNGYGYREVS